MSVCASAVSGVASKFQGVSTQQGCLVGLVMVIILLWMLRRLHNGTTIRAVINSDEHVELPRWRNKLKMAHIRAGMTGRKLAEVDALAHGRPISQPANPGGLE